MIDSDAELARLVAYYTANPSATNEQAYAFVYGRSVALGVSPSAYINAIANAITPIGGKLPPEPPGFGPWIQGWVNWFFGTPIQPIVPGPIQP